MKNDHCWTKVLFNFLGVTTLLVSPVVANAQTGVITDAIVAKAKAIVSKMTLEEKVDYIGGDEDGFSIRAIPRLGLPAVKMADGPQGMRNNVQSTLYPCGILSAASWNRALVHRVGNALGTDFHSYGIGFLLGPGVNIYRAPMNGRNFEYFGEDPYLASETALAYILGVQEKGVIATIKHFALNNEEWDRHTISTNADERTMEEIYFPTFRKSIEKGHVGAVMNSYNIVNGIHASENPWLLRTKLRDEWGFRGILMSDWGSTYGNGFESAMGGLDLEMPHGDFMNRITLIPLVKNGVLPEAVIDEHVQHIVQTLLAFNLLDKPLTVNHPKGSDWPESRQTALDMAREGIVLLKNNGALPLKGSTAVIGPNADIIVKGGGSGEVNPFHTVTLWQGLHNADHKAQFISNSQWMPHTPLTWKAQYFANKELKGQPVLEREEKELNQHWTTSAPDTSMKRTNFSARWTTHYTPSADFKAMLTASGDDGFRVFVDGQKVIDDWHDQAVQTRKTLIDLKKGHDYTIVMEYYQKDGDAEAGLSLDSFNPSNLAKILGKYDNIIVSVGFNHDTEGEGSDRQFALDNFQQQLINIAEASGRKVTVVINSGGGVEMKPWLDKASAVVMAWYPGQEGGTALAEILTGELSPSGKLPISIEAKWEDNPDSKSYYENEKTKGRVLYSEGVFTGYRGYDQTGVKPLFPFGFGLSYTTFAYSNLKVSKTGNNQVAVSFDITNTGIRAGKEIAELYVHQEKSSVPRPEKELKGYEKISLKPGEKKRVTIRLDEEAFHYYDINDHCFKVESGKYDILVGGSSQNLPLKASVNM
ncbi:glycoside hydrolase family 3 C-terminal domain-containing protein [Hallella multisaccharivorax]|uniref:glycoside hydrolase family 3 C-terminal domain-containing protein n=1 Tax=Hallella multisaccharivorax TaxID=310514 RepID=UPI00361D4486